VGVGWGWVVGWWLTGAAAAGAGALC